MKTGQIISTLREKHGLTQSELADSLFVSRELVSKWETGKRIPDYEMMSRLAAFFSVSVEKISDRDERIISELSLCFPSDAVLTVEDTIRLINSFLNTLSSQDRILFISRYYYHQSSAETAALLSLSEGNVRKKLSSIRNKLRQFIKECNDE